MSTFEKVSKWNAKCGVERLPAGTQDWYRELQDRLNRVAEEINEAQKALNEGNILEVIDAGLDLAVVVAGFNYVSGMDYNAGMKLILENNDLKHTKSKRKAENWVKFHKDNNADVRLQETLYGSQMYYCVRRNSDGKIMKPGAFPKVDLTNVCPQLATVVGLLLDDSEVGPTAEQEEYMVRTNMAPIFLDKFPEEDAVREVMEAISKEAAGKGAFILLQNNLVVGAEIFDTKGPSGGVEATPTEDTDVAFEPENKEE